MPVEVYAHPEVRLQKARIREMTPDDLPQVMRIEFAVFDQPWSPQAFALELSSNPSALYLVLEDIKADSPAIIGYIGLWQTQDKVWITRIAVDPSHMRQGWGSCLLRQAQAQAENWGLKSIALEVRESNSRACAFYLSEGYEQVEILYDYYSLPQENARVFMKRLDNPLESD